MSKHLYVKSYRKLIDVGFELSPTINIISGTNGTCKSSILYLLSNSYQEIKGEHNLKDCINIINNINNLMNPKIESLSRGDKEYNDPTNNTKGTILEVEYFDGTKLEFRKHNSPKNSRYAIKPPYANRKKESLPKLPVIYLGLSRLISYGEYHELNFESIIEKLSKKLDETSLKSVQSILKRELKNNYISEINKKLPDKYISIINKVYAGFTNIEVSHQTYNSIGNLKKRAEFNTSFTGIDSNTISAGEDNLYIIITALVSLQYYYDELQKCSRMNSSKIESLLLIDELDATLHPSYQIKLFQLFQKYTSEFGIQIVCTTHSLNLIDYGLKQKAQVIYLLNEQNKVNIINDIDMFTINMYLRQITMEQMDNNKIPVFTEDQEARDLLNILFMMYSDIDGNFNNIKGNFHLVDGNMGCDNLKSIFHDSLLTESVLKAICILDGDAQKELNRNIITLPGQKNPEELIFLYLKRLIKEPKYQEFWSINREHVKKGYTFDYAKDILEKINELEDNISKIREQEGTIKGIRRQKNKKIYREYKYFFEIIFMEWFNDRDNRKEIVDFYNDLHSVFRKTFVAYNIPSSAWKRKKYLFESEQYASN
ncbi:AAA family ATPase [Paenibacillus sp. JJ1683]